jgi:hypothetical protein
MSGNAQEVKAAAQIVNLLSLVEANAGIRDRLLVTSEAISVVQNGTYRQVDIKVIIELKNIADDSRFHTDAVRRIRELTYSPVDYYRIFFVQRPSKGGAFIFQVLGIFERSVAYIPATLAELTRRY